MSGWWSRNRADVLLCLAIAVGAALRFVWSDDIEYKGDEEYTFERTIAFRRGEGAPAFGMQTSAGPLNPGLSVWAFLGLGWLFRVETPPDLARAVAAASVLAFALFVPFVRRLIPEGEREAWRWGVALTAVNPILVLLHRKIWPPSLFPLLVLAALAGWRTRDRAGGAFLWGLCGAILGQLHAPGFFFAGGIVLWTALFDRESVRWRAWFVGSVVGAVPLVPWLLYLDDPGRAETTHLSYETRLTGAMHWVRWASQPFGWSVWPSFGRHFVDFLAGPHIGPTPTYGIAALHVVAAGIGLSVGIDALGIVWRRRRAWRTFLVGRDSATSFLIAATVLGAGLLYLCAGRPFRWHYGIVWWPLPAVGVAWVLDGRPRARARLVALAVSLTLISVGMLAYLRTHDGAPLGDFGVVWRAQAP